MCLWPKVATVGALERPSSIGLPAREALAAARAREAVLGPAGDAPLIYLFSSLQAG